MNNFESLIDELKEENLLEETVTEINKAEREAELKSEKSSVAAENSFEESNAEFDEPIVQNDISEDIERFSTDEQTDLNEGENLIAKENQIENEVLHVETEKNESQPMPDIKPSPAPVDQIEYFRKRASDEVAGLQIVEHIFSGIDRQQKKIVPKPFDDLKVKKSLHNFLQISADVKSPEHAQAEFQLMQETESWYSALSHRDKQISVTHLRRYCETAKPVLSSQALMALARFYRISPYSEAVRSKFDLIVTRLFSKDLDDSKREIAFGRDDLIRHLTGLYAEWESVSLFSGEENEAEILLSAFKFEDFMNEAENAESFDELVRNDFFNRLRSFKQSAGEKFFAPLVTATAIESNVRIGNRYIELLELEREKGEIEKLENKYGFLHDQVISDATSKTLQLVELLKIKAEKPPVAEVSEKPVKEKAIQAKDTPKKESAAPPTPKPNFQLPDENDHQGFLAANKWLISLACIALIIFGALYLRSAYFSKAEKSSVQETKKVNLESSSLKEFIRDATISGDAFSATVQPNWDNLSQEKRDEILKKIQSIGNDKGFTKIQLLDADGKTVAALP